MPADIIGFGYALTVAAGGIIGYLKAGSVPSLAAGLAFGALAGAGAYQTTQDPNNVKISLGFRQTDGTEQNIIKPVTAPTSEHVTSIALLALMGYRFSNSGKFMPAGLVATLSVLMVLKCGYKIYTQ